MVILDPIVRVLLHVVKRAGQELIDRNAERRGATGHDLDRIAMRANGRRE